MGGTTPLNHNLNVLCVDLLFKKTTIKNSTLAKNAIRSRNIWVPTTLLSTQKVGSRSRQNGNPYLSNF